MQNLVKLEGTEKQVAWAEDIRAKALNQKDTVIQYYQRMGADATRLAEWAIEKIAQQESASWWIGVRGEDLDTILRTNIPVFAKCMLNPTATNVDWLIAKNPEIKDVV